MKAMVESVDKGVGRIIDRLRSLGLEENTLVIVTSDNGGYVTYESGGFKNISSNGPLRGQKTEVYEGGHRIPAIAWWPGRVRAGTESGSVVMTMDMFPTFCELAGISLSGEMEIDGSSIVTILEGNSALPERSVCWKNGDNRAIRSGCWKLCLIGDSTPELYNLEEDPGETRDLSSHNPEIVGRMIAEYRAWEEEVTKNY